MAPRKSIPALQELCWKTAIIDVRILQRQANLLPTYFIDELYKRLIKNDESNFLPSKLVLHPKIRELLDIPFDLRSKSKIKEKFSRDCKNLRRIVLHHYHLFVPPESLTYITANNPLLLHLDLTGTNDFSGLYLVQISKHCPQLQHLNLQHVTNITDFCMDYLPKTLTFLNVCHTDITPRGCIIALKRLKLLKELEYHNWLRIFSLLTHQGHKSQTFSIECLTVRDHEMDRTINFGNIIIEMFPKLSDIRLVILMNNTIIRSLKEKEKLNLITRLHLHFVIEDVILISKLCPRLEVLTVWILSFNEPTEINYAQKHECVPFKHLRKLELNVRYRWLQLDDFKLLLTNFKWLTSLHIYGWHDLGDLVIYEVIEENLLQNLESIFLYNCGPFFASALIALMNSLDCLKFVNIRQCNFITNNEYEILEKAIHDENWDISLSKDYLMQ